MWVLTQAPSLRGGACGFARRRGKRGHCCAARRGRRALQRGRMHPTGRMRIRPTACFRSVLLRGTPGTAFPTGRVRIRRMFVIISPLLRGCRDAAPYKAAACFPPFPSPSGGRWHPPIPREADDGRGRTSPLADGKTVAFPRGWRSFPHRGSVTFSLSGRPCGRHPPPLGEGPGEGTLVVSPGTVLIDNFFPREAQNLSSRTLPTSATRAFPRFLSAAFPCQFPQDSL